MSKAKTDVDTTRSSTAESPSESGRNRDAGGADPFEIVFRFVEKVAKTDEVADALDRARSLLSSMRGDDGGNQRLVTALYRIMNGEIDPRSIAAEALDAPSSFVEHLKSSPTIVGVDMAAPGSDATAFATFDLSTGKVADVRVARTIPLWCPHCGKPHVDRHEWATRPHHKHLCHDDAHGRGCGKLFRIGEPGSAEYAFGAEQLIASSVRQEIGDRVVLLTPIAAELAREFDDVRDAWHGVVDEARRAGGFSDKADTGFVSADGLLLDLKKRVVGV